MCLQPVKKLLHSVAIVIFVSSFKSAADQFHAWNGVLKEKLIKSADWLVEKKIEADPFSDMIV